MNVRARALVVADFEFNSYFAVSFDAKIPSKQNYEAVP
jgi:hypothetical protein